MVPFLSDFRRVGLSHRKIHKVVTLSTADLHPDFVEIALRAVTTEAEAGVTAQPVMGEDAALASVAHANRSLYFPHVRSYSATTTGCASVPAVNSTTFDRRVMGMKRV